MPRQSKPKPEPEFNAEKFYDGNKYIGFWIINRRTSGNFEPDTDPIYFGATEQDIIDQVQKDCEPSDLREGRFVISKLTPQFNRVIIQTKVDIESIF